MRIWLCANPYKEIWKTKKGNGKEATKNVYAYR